MNSEGICATLPSKSMENRCPRAFTPPMLGPPEVCAFGLTTMFVTTLGFAAQSETDLMRQAKISTAQAEKIALTKVAKGKSEARSWRTDMARWSAPSTSPVR